MIHFKGIFFIVAYLGLNLKLSSAPLHKKLKNESVHIFSCNNSKITNDDSFSENLLYRWLLRSQLKIEICFLEKLNNI